MQPATALALAATVANMLQGWDNGAIGGALLFLKPELKVSPSMEGFIVAASLGSAWCSNLYSGAGADRFGRRKMLSISSCFFVLSSCIMTWTPNVYVLLLARVLLGCGVGLITTIVPMYIAEIAPSEIRGKLLTFPQFMGSSGQFVSYVIVFIISLNKTPAWRYMLGVLLLPAVANFFISFLYLPESPRWLVSKGRMVEAKKVLQRLRNQTDVTAELALLVEGLSVGTETALEEWQLKPVDASTPQKHGSFLQSFKVEQSFSRQPDTGGVSWMGSSMTMDPAHGLVSRRGSMAEVPNQITSMKDPVVTLFGSMHSMHDNLPPGTVFGTFRSTHDFLPEAQCDIFEDKNDDKNENWDEEGQQTPTGNGYQSDDNMVGDMDEQLNTPLLNRLRSGKSDWSRAGTPRGRNYGDFQPLPRGESRDVMTRHSSVVVGSVPESIASVGIGGGWQLAWQWTGREGQEGNPEEGQFKRVFLLQQDQQNQQNEISSMSLPGIEPELIQAAALVGQPAQYKEIVSEHPVGPAMVHPAETASSGPSWSELTEVGVRRALIVGVGLQILQQCSGINAVQSFIPQILEQSGASALLTNLGLNSNSASILASTASSLLVLPCIFLAMKLIDQAGRRQLLLCTMPVLFVSLIVIAVSDLFLPAGMLKASGSFLGVVVYMCTFVMGFGAIPNILCSEIFPTRVRGLCISICQTAMWSCNIMVTNLFPTLLAAIKVGGIFSVFSGVVFSSWIFVYLKVPETKGMPLEVISEFFAMAATKQA